MKISINIKYHRFCFLLLFYPTRLLFQLPMAMVLDTVMETGMDILDIDMVTSMDTMERGKLVLKGIGS